MREKSSEIPILRLPESKTENNVFIISTNKISLKKAEYLISNEEFKRSKNIINHKSRVEFIVSRAIIRKTFSKFFKISPFDVPIVIDHRGRPSLKLSNSVDINFDFNIAHSDGTVALVFSRYQSVGIDLERIKNLQNSIILEGNLLSESERKNYGLNIKSEKLAQLWTLKEAVLKAYGTGFLVSPHLITIRNSRKTDGLHSLTFSSGEELFFWTKSYKIFPDYQCTVVSIVKELDKKLSFNFNFL